MRFFCCLNLFLNLRLGSVLGLVVLNNECMTTHCDDKSFDFLRGIAVLLVMTAHGLPGYLSTHVGWTGVNLFFVLSGFFVSGILFREYREKWENACRSVFYATHF